MTRQGTPPSPFSIRAGIASDTATIVRFQLTMARESEDLELDPRVVEAGVAAVFSDPRRGAYWVAEQAGELVGCLLTVPEWSDWRNGEVLWIHSVYVTPPARGQGVYRALYEHLMSRVENDPKLRGLRLYVDKRNVSAQRAYQALGMSREHYHLYEWLEDG